MENELELEPPSAHVREYVERMGELRDCKRNGHIWLVRLSSQLLLPLLNRLLSGSFPSLVPIRSLFTLTAG